MEDGLVSAVATLLGGVGLFLVGMSLMTDGLKLGAGNALQSVLANWTSTRYRGLGAGILVTAIVQSSSAVTVSTIGFANAGLLTLEQAVWVIFGSNVGTTMTGWIVALVGFKVNMEALALPIVAVGTVLKVAGGKRKPGAFGTALIGFGLLFLGIGVLTESFGNVGASFTLPAVGDSYLKMVLLYTLFGVLLTTVMQSSSAAIVVALSAAEGGLIPLTAAAAVVLGANLGTTTTALISMIGATPTAKRVAISHLAFNMLTALVALAILTPLLSLVEFVRGLLGISAAPAMTLALFHTAFNILGVLLIWPLSGRLITWLNKRFLITSETEARPKFLDSTLLGMPTLAATALQREIARLGDIAARVATTALSAVGDDRAKLLSDCKLTRTLAEEIGNFVTQLGRSELPTEVAAMLPLALRTSHRYLTIVDSALRLSELRAGTVQLPDEALRSELNEFETALMQLVKASSAAQPEVHVADVEAALAAVLEARSRLRQSVLKAASHGTLGMAALDGVLTHLALGRDIAQQFARAASARIIAQTGAVGSAQTAAALESDPHSSTEDAS